MVKRCCIKGCKATGQTMHRFPNPRRELGLFYIWLGILQMQTTDPIYTYGSKRVCFAHFDPSLKSPGHKILHRYAIPTIGVPVALNAPASTPETETVAADLNETTS